MSEEVQIRLNRKPKGKNEMQKNPKEKKPSRGNVGTIYLGRCYQLCVFDPSERDDLFEKQKCTI